MTGQSGVDEYNDTDHANTYKRLEPKADRASAEIDADYEALMREGYVIIKNLSLIHI